MSTGKRKLGWLRNKSHSRRLPAWRYESEYLLWRIKISDDDLILVEERDTDARTASFACVSCADGKVLWERLRFEEPWWIGLADIHNGTAYFHGYRQPNLPAPRGIHAVDMKTGRVRWSDPGRVFLFAFDDDVFTSVEMFEGRHYFILDAGNGALTSDIGQDEERIRDLRSKLNEIDQFADYVYPQPLDESYPGRELIMPLLAGYINNDVAAGSPDILVHGRLVIAAWHEPAEQALSDGTVLDQYIIVVDKRDGDVLYTEQLNTNISSPSPDSFFVRKDQLFHVKDGRILTVHTIPSDYLP
jgi:hypothetical protein